MTHEHPHHPTFDSVSISQVVGLADFGFTRRTKKMVSRVGIEPTTRRLRGRRNSALFNYAGASEPNAGLSQPAGPTRIQAYTGPSPQNLK